MHLFSTHSWDPGIIVFADFLSTLVFWFLTWFQPLPVLHLYHSCILHYLLFSLSDCCLTWANVQRSVACDVLLGRFLCSCKRNTLSQIPHWAQSGFDSHLSELDSGQSHMHSESFSHGPPVDHKAWLPPTWHVTLRLSASHCAPSSDDCAINSSTIGCFPYVASIYICLSNVTIHPYLHCGGNSFLLLFIAVIKHHPQSISNSHWILLVCVFVWSHDTRSNTSVLHVTPDKQTEP